MINGAFFGNNPSLIVDQGISASITSASDGTINARFNISINDVGGFHSVFVENAQGISNPGSFFVQIPSEFIPLSFTTTNPNCAIDPDTNQQMVGVAGSVHYQVADQLGQPISFAGMTPQEHFTVTGPNGTNEPFPGFKPFADPPTTDASGQFFDTPVGTCFTPVDFNVCVVVRQTFNIVLGSVTYNIPTVTSRCDCIQGVGIRVITGTSARSQTLGTTNCQ